MQREGRAARYSLASVLLVLSGCNGGAATNGLSRTGFQPAFLAPAQPGLRWEGPGAMKCWRSAPAVASPRTRSVTRGLVMGADGGEDFLRSFASFLGLPSSAEDRRKAQVEMKRRREGARRGPPVEKKPAPPPSVGNYIPPEQCPSGQKTEGGGIQEQERVRWEAMKQGDQMKQNDILRKTISGGG
ncbi:hypothetical protein T484DRAFT_1934082 [Baffinella frigidus]|nr:hypothetical protein T484DRAFT_1934082 [Cryptophyta sp. CCMP2293]